MENLKLKMIKEVIETSNLPNAVVADAFGFKDVKDLNIEFIDTFGMSVSEFRKHCREMSKSEKVEDQNTLSAG